MGQGPSSQREVRYEEGEQLPGEMTESHKVKISYVGALPGMVGRHMTMIVGTSSLTQKALLPTGGYFAGNAKNGDVTIDVDLDTYFRPTGAIQAALRDKSLMGYYAGVHIDALNILGRFDDSVSRHERVQWWNDVKQLVTYMGFVFRPYAEVRCLLVKEGAFNKAALFEMRGMEVSIDGLIFE
jgi:hypothetical protein